jgi:hypothetical protein
VRIGFFPREDLLEPVAAIALGAAARALADGLLRRSDEQLAALRGASGDGLLAVAGEGAVLPWADGVVYLGRDPAAPRLLLPTMLRPSAPLEAFERAIARRAAPESAPWAILASPPVVFSLAAARPIERSHLRRWLEAQP